MPEDEQGPTIAERLAAALSHDQFILHSQEIRPLNPTPGQRPFQEILVRFQEEEEKLLPPGLFFPVLEDNGLVPQLDRWVAESVIKWIRRGIGVNSDWIVPCNSLNLASDTIRDPGFATFIRKHVEVAQNPPGTLVFEIGWPTIEKHGAETQNLMMQLKAAGCRFVFPGFEGDEDSFAVLRRLRPDFVKFDTRLIRNLKPNSAESHGLTVVNRMCHTLGIATIAEQVESEEVLAEVKRLEIDYAQGFGISLPKPLS